MSANKRQTNKLFNFIYPYLVNTRNLPKKQRWFAKERDYLDKETNQYPLTITNVPLPVLSS